MRFGAARRAGPGVAALVVLAAAGARAERHEVVVSAAASLRTVLDEVVARYGQLHPATEVVVNSAASGVLEKQIERGAPVDLFLSASRVEIDRLEKAGLVSRRAVFAAGSLVVVVPRDAKPPASFEGLVDPSFGRIAIGDPGTVPCGRYARQALESLGLWERVEPRLIPAGNVRQVLEYVARGEVDAGVVYDTDAGLLPDRVVRGPQAPPGSHDPIVYEGAVPTGAPDAGQADAVLRFLLSEEGRRILARRGFLPPTAP